MTMQNVGEGRELSEINNQDYGKRIKQIGIMHYFIAQFPDLTTSKTN